MENMPPPQTINCGPTGADRLPTAFTKVNLNFQGLDSRLITVETGGAGGIYTGAAGDPNGSVTPDDPDSPAIYYCLDPLALWFWDITNDVWVVVLTADTGTTPPVLPGAPATTEAGGTTESGAPSTEE